eukprot:jgi/Bigna1/61441/fgenesh1_kg.22_\
MSKDSSIWEAKFEVLRINPEGKKFEKVSRIECNAKDYDMELKLDVHWKLFKCKPGEWIDFALASTIELNASSATDIYKNMAL